MPRNNRQEDEIVQKDPPPRRSGSSNIWTSILLVLTQRGRIGKWHMVKEFDEPEQAQNAQGNLSQRKATIPYPDHDWSFSARGCELYAIYRGPNKTKVEVEAAKPRAKRSEGFR